MRSIFFNNILVSNKDSPVDIIDLHLFAIYKKIWRQNIHRRTQGRVVEGPCPPTDASLKEPVSNSGNILDLLYMLYTQKSDKIGYNPEHADASGFKQDLWREKSSFKLGTKPFICFNLNFVQCNWTRYFTHYYIITEEAFEMNPLK